LLAFDELDTLTEPILELYEVYIQSVLNEIARRLRGMKLTSSTAWMMQRLTESGLIYEHALKELEKLTGISEKDLRRAFIKAGVRATRFDDTVYKAAGLKPLPLNMSPAMTQVLAAGLRKTGGVMRNLTMTTALSAQNLFIEAADLAYMQVASGAFDYISALRDAVEHVARKGLTVIRFPGRSEQLDVAMRRVVLTGIGQTTGELQLTRAQEMGMNLMQVSAHIGARNEGTGPMNHESWQGKVYSIVGSTPEYPNLAEVTGLGTVVGLHGVNCRHSMYPFYEGLSEKLYTQKELDEYANQKVVYQGKEMSVYEATQQQRAIERKIREWKRKAGALEAAGLDHERETAKVREWQARMREFVKETGLIRQGEREQVFLGDIPKKREKYGSTSSDSLLESIQNLNSDGVVPLGEINREIVENWTENVDGNLSVVLTGKQRDHYLEKHPEMKQFEGNLSSVVIDPDEVHRNSHDPMMAIFYKQHIDDLYFRTAVLMQSEPGALNHSVLSYRFSRKRTVVVNRKNGRQVWKK